MSRLALAPLGLVLGGCTRIDLNHRALLPAEGLQAVEVTLERGSFTWWGSGRPEVAVDVWSWGSGASVARARAIEQSNRWGVLVDDGTASFWADSPSDRAGVDMAASGPGRVDLDAITLDGALWIEELQGSVIATADEITAVGLVGSVDLFAWGGIEASVRPARGDLLLLEVVRGDVRLGLPHGLDYDLEVEGGAGSSIDVEDLGFDEILSGPGTVDAVTGAATTTVRVIAHGGDVVIYEVGS